MIAQSVECGSGRDRGPTQSKCCSRERMSDLLLDNLGHEVWSLADLHYARPLSSSYAEIDGSAAQGRLTAFRHSSSGVLGETECLFDDDDEGGSHHTEVNSKRICRSNVLFSFAVCLGLWASCVVRFLLCLFILTIALPCPIPRIVGEVGGNSDCDSSVGCYRRHVQKVWPNCTHR